MFISNSEMLTHLITSIKSFHCYNYKDNISKLTLCKSYHSWFSCLNVWFFAKILICKQKRLKLGWYIVYWYVDQHSSVGWVFLHLVSSPPLALPDFYMDWYWISWFLFSMYSCLFHSVLCFTFWKKCAREITL